MEDYNFVISESRDHCERYSETLIYALLMLTKPYSNFPEIRQFVDNSVRSSDVLLLLLLLLLFLSSFKVDFYITFYNYKKSINVNQSESDQSE